MKVCHKCGHQGEGRWLEIAIHATFDSHLNQLFAEEFILCDECVVKFYNTLSLFIGEVTKEPDAKRKNKTPLPPTRATKSKAVKVATPAETEPKESRPRTQLGQPSPPTVAAIGRF